MNPVGLQIMDGYELRQTDGLSTKWAFRLEQEASVKQYQILQGTADFFPCPPNDTIPTEHVPAIGGTPICPLLQTKCALPATPDLFWDCSDVQNGPLILFCGDWGSTLWIVNAQDR